MATTKNGNKRPAKAAKTAEKKPYKINSPIHTLLIQFLGTERRSVRSLYLAAVLYGGFFPIVAYTSAHTLTWAWDMETAIRVLLTSFCLGFSLPTALQFGKVVFGGLKGIGFALGLELAMIAGNFPLFWKITPSAIALTLLMSINIIAVFFQITTGRQFSALAEKFAEAK